MSMFKGENIVKASSHIKTVVKSGKGLEFGSVILRPKNGCENYN